MAEEAGDTPSSRHSVRVRHKSSKKLHEMFFPTLPTPNEVAERIYQEFHSGEENITAAQIQLTGPNGESYSGRRPLPDVDLDYHIDEWGHVDRIVAFNCMDAAGSANYEVKENLAGIVEYPLHAGRDVVTPSYREVAEAAEAACGQAPNTQEVKKTRKIKMRHWNSDGPSGEMTISSDASVVQVEAQVFEDFIPKPTEIKASHIIVFKDGRYREFPAPFRKLVGDDFAYHVLAESPILPFPDSFRNCGLDDLLKSARRAKELGFDNTPLWREVVLVMQAFISAESVTAEGRGEVLMGEDDVVCNPSHLMETLMNIVKDAEECKRFTLKDLANILQEEFDASPYHLRHKAGEVNKELWRTFFSRLEQSSQG